MRKFLNELGMEVRLAALAATLEGVRRLRPPPLRDDKVVA